MNLPGSDKVTLDNCDQEPIHIPGFVQPHGALFAFDRSGLLTYRSANAPALLGDSIPELGSRLQASDFPEFEGLHELIQNAQDATDGEMIPDAMAADTASGSYDIVIHRTASGVICEFEETSACIPVPRGFAFASHRSVERLKREQSVEGLLIAAVEEVRRMTGFDRVMAYRFRHDDSGEVVAEDLADFLDPFLGRRYPASDIPAQARRLYIINTLRLIADVRSEAVPVESAQNVDSPLDMSHCVLRSVSPVHIEYLGNMGVGASMSVSIILGGRLWGMIACHHMGPRHVPYTVRMACDVLSQVLAANLQGVLAKEAATRAHADASLRSRIVEQVLHADDVIRGLALEAPALLAAFSAHAVVVSDGRKTEINGEITLDAANDLVEWLNAAELPTGRLFFTDSIATLPKAPFQPFSSWCGLLAVPFGAEARAWLLLLRKEQIETVLWGGKPEKEYRVGPLGPRLTPRGSFDLWKEIVRGKAVPWSESDQENAQKLQDELSRADAAHSAEVSRARHQLMAMLGHDLRSPIQAISLTASLMQQRGGDAQLSGRLHSTSTRMQRLVEQVMDMSQAHSGTLRFEMQRFDLAQLVHQLVAEARVVRPTLTFQPMVPSTLFVEADADRIAQVVSNLLGNAGLYGDASEPVLIQLSERDGMAVLEVSNSSRPIPADMAETLFKPFKRIARQGTINRNGLGLGLYIADQIVRGHQGTLGYSYSDPYVTFTAAIPVKVPGESL